MSLLSRGWPRWTEPNLPSPILRLGPKEKLSGGGFVVEGAPFDSVKPQRIDESNGSQMFYFLLYHTPPNNVVHNRSRLRFW